MSGYTKKTFTEITQKPQQPSSVFSVFTLYLYCSFRSFHRSCFQFFKEICRDVLPHLQSSVLEVGCIFCFLQSDDDVLTSYTSFQTQSIELSSVRCCRSWTFLGA
ncbi:hypothetical protein AOLI_G00331330 [Acnodon oligacanthus]